MAPGMEFDFLASTWGIELSAKAKAEITNFAESLGKSDIEEYIKDSDIRKLGVNANLPKDVTRLNGPLPNGSYLVQVQKIVDITQPAKFQEDFEGGKWRLLSFDFTDGEQKNLKGIEYTSLQKLDIGVHVPPGTKLLLTSSDRQPLRVQNGHMLLRPEVVQKLGGEVSQLKSNWLASKEVEENRLLWKTEGIKKKEKGEKGAPPWVQFDPKKAPRGKDASIWKQQAEEERRQWAKGVDTVGAAAKEEEIADEEEQGPRFQVQEFAKEDTLALKSNVTSAAFKREEHHGKGKGKKGDSEGGKGGKGKKGRHGGGDDDWGGEEKRAPTQATSSLAAFIKPSKTGELSDAAVNMLLEPEPAANVGTASNGGAWGAHSWDASGWDAGGWDASGWDAGSWSGGGWSSSGRSGGRGGRKGGGSSRGGGKKGGGGKRR